MHAAVKVFKNGCRLFECLIFLPAQPQACWAHFSEKLTSQTSSQEVNERSKCLTPQSKGQIVYTRYIYKRYYVTVVMSYGDVARHYIDVIYKNNNLLLGLHSPLVLASASTKYAVQGMCRHAHWEPNNCRERRVQKPWPLDNYWPTCTDINCTSKLIFI